MTTTLNKGDVIYKVVGEITIISQQDTVNLEQDTPEIIERRKQRLVDHLWQAIRNYFVEAVGVDMSLRVDPVTATRYPSSFGADYTVLECRAVIAPLHKEGVVAGNELRSTGR